jgi:hypothetical protein
MNPTGSRAGGLALACVAVALLLSGCSRQGSTDPKPARPPTTPTNGFKIEATPARGVMADDIPIAHTPPGGYGKTFPKPVLAACTEPLARGAPDLRGLWKTLRAERGGKRVPAGDRIYAYVERIEQCGDRIVDMGGGTIADARADGTLKNGDHDVSAFDYKTRINVIATYESGVFVLRPVFIPWIPVGIPGIEVTRQLDSEGHMVWIRPDLGHIKVTLERIGKATDPYTRS